MTMPLAHLCSFCGNPIEPGTGTMYVRKDGTVFYFCSSKCEKNLIQLKRVPRTVPWTQAAVLAKARAAGLSVEESGPVVAVEAEVGEVAEDFDLQLPKGKDIPIAIRDLIDKRLGPELGKGRIERHFKDFSASELLRESIGTWYAKRHPRKRVTEIEVDEYVAYLDTSSGKKVLKEWLEEMAKSGKGK